MVRCAAVDDIRRMRRQHDIITRRASSATRVYSGSSRQLLPVTISDRRHVRSATQRMYTTSLACASQVNVAPVATRLSTRIYDATYFSSIGPPSGLVVTTNPDRPAIASQRRRLETENNLNHDSTPFTVSVYPIQQEPGIWFASYMISEYRDGAERVVANVSMRHATHGSEAKAKQAARNAGDGAVAHMDRSRLNGALRTSLRYSRNPA